MKTVFISMPMREKTYEEIQKEYDRLLKAVGEFLKNGNVVLVRNYLSKTAKPLACLGESIKRMAEADYVLFADGFESARGCKIEHTCAREYDKKILIEINNQIQDKKQ